jgi:transcriptional regulator with XRE-family HTH domain
METYSGRATRYLRKALGLKQREMASCLGISVVHYCNIENGKAHPSPELLSRYRDIWDIDLYVLGWSLYGDLGKLPRPLREAAAAIAKTWKRELRRRLTSPHQLAD